MEQSKSSHEIVELPGMILTGMAVDCPGFDASPIPALYERFFACWQELPAWRESAGDRLVWGASLPAMDGFRYLAALRAESSEGLPQGFEAAEIPGGPYVKVPFVGRPEQMGLEFKRIIDELMPAIGHPPKPGLCCLEEYPPDPMNMETGELTCDLYVQIL
jgi:predicted transcriptional regulator YdeE